MTIKNVLHSILIFLCFQVAIHGTVEKNFLQAQRDQDNPKWLLNQAWIGDVQNPEAIEWCLFRRDGYGFWTPDHREESQKREFRFSVKPLGEEHYKISFEDADGQSRSMDFRRQTGRFERVLPDGTKLIFQQRIDFQEAPFPGASKNFYGHRERK